jgi:nicotinamide riboside kinase
LGEVLGLPVIGEGMREYLQRTGVDLHSLGHDDFQALVQQLWEERKEAEARATTGFVADRSSFDFAAFWLYYRFAREDAYTEQLFAEATDERRYDRIYVLPWGRIPLVRDGVRTADRYVQLHLQLLVEGLLEQRAHNWRRVVEESLEGRIAEVLGDLHRMPEVVYGPDKR